MGLFGANSGTFFSLIEAFKPFLVFSSCSSGKRYYWESMTDTSPMAEYLTPTGIAYDVSNDAGDCNNFCMCDASNNCLVPTNNNKFSAVFLPYCNGKLLQFFNTFTF